MTIQRVGPDGSDEVSVTGEMIGTGDTPCWGGTRNTVYRARVPNSVVNGAGTYLVTVPEEVPGTTDGTNPWARSPLPAYNGASLAVVFEGFGEVLIYDVGLSGTEFDGVLRYTLRVPPSSRISSNLLLHMVISDGQKGNGGYGSLERVAGDITRANGDRIAGRNSPGNDSNMNGHSGGAVAQLWDNDIQSVPGNNSNMRIKLEAPEDCIVTVMNALDTPF